MSHKNSHIRQLTPKQARRLFDRVARSTFGISGEQFVRAYRAGKFDGTDHLKLMRVVPLLPLVE